MQADGPALTPMSDHVKAFWSYLRNKDISQVIVRLDNGSMASSSFGPDVAAALVADYEATRGPVMQADKELVERLREYVADEYLSRPFHRLVCEAVAALEASAAREAEYRKQLVDAVAEAEKLRVSLDVTTRAHVFAVSDLASEHKKVVVAKAEVEKLRAEVAHLTTENAELRAASIRSDNALYEARSRAEAAEAETLRAWTLLKETGEAAEARIAALVTAVKDAQVSLDPNGETQWWRTCRRLLEDAKDA